MKITMSGQAYEAGIVPYEWGSLLPAPTFRRAGRGGQQVAYVVEPEIARRIVEHLELLAKELNGNANATDHASMLALRASGRICALAADRIRDQITAEERRVAREAGRR
jgi:hypothetical protein